MARTLEHLLVRVGGETAGLRTALTAAEQQVATSTNKMNVTLSRMALSFRGLGPIAQQAGFQVADFAVQVASGQGAMRAFVQQGSQLLGFFGPWGAIVGAAVAVGGALVMQLGLMEKQAGLTEEELKRLNLTQEEGANAASIQEVALERMNALLLTSKERARAAADEQKRLAIATTEAAISAAHAQLQYMADTEASVRRLQATGFSNVGLPPDWEKQRTDTVNQINRLEKLLSAVSNTSIEDLPGLQGSEKSTKAKQEADSALQDLIGDQFTEIRLQQMSNRERAIEETVLRASAAAMKDYNEHLRDSPLLTPEELEGIKARAAALYDVAAAQDALRQSQKEAEKTAKAEQKRVEELNRELGRFAERMIGSANASTSWKDILINNIDEIATALSSLLNLDTGGESGLSGIFASIFGAVASGIGGGIGIGSGSVVGGPGFGTPRAGGGRVLPGFDYIVGERKPERVRFDRPGTVSANDNGGGAGPIFVLNMPGATMEAVQEVRRMVLALNGSIEQRAVKAVWTESKAGGPLAMSRRSG